MQPTLALLLSVALVLQLLLFLLFGRFVAPRWKIYVQIGFYLLLSWILASSLGWWSLLWITGHPLLTVIAHATWCRNHGIDWRTCEPREEYLRLRPWEIGDGLAGAE